MVRLMQVSVAGEGQPTTSKVLLSVEETCEALAISRTKLHDLVRQGKIRPVKIGEGRSGGIRFRPSDLQAFAADNLK